MMQNNNELTRISIAILFITIFIATVNCSLLNFASSANAETAQQIQAKIDQKNLDIQNLEKVIKGYQIQIDDLGSQADSLSSTIKSLQLTQKKLEANISVTKDKITTKTFEIEQLGSQIDTKENNIGDDQRVIAQSFKQLNQMGNTDITQIIFGSHSVSGALNTLEELSVMQKNIFDKISSLNKDKDQLEVNKSASEKAKSDLLSLNKQLADQRKVVLSTVSQQDSLLKQTNESETSYKKLLAQKKAEQAAFQAEINNFESQLHMLMDPLKLPSAGSSVLVWPLSSVKITQYFGNTDFSNANPQIYNGKGHTGLDFRASIGTPVIAALSGTIIGSSNTDLVRGCYSYGQWLMIKHANGLSTLYGHLSLRSVSVGDKIATGQIIGYSGNTGYSTGPHLHFGVYASDGVQIKKFDTSINCKGATIPVADFKAYLNPLMYLPKQ
ncbi:MAG: peptidoglycan DD-metalloendopeptidase family protein [Candidatus Taylorbacteria bacterium]